MKPLEEEIKEFTEIGEFMGYRILARGEERILYDPTKREISLRYTTKDDICKYIKEKKK